MLKRQSKRSSKAAKLRPKKSRRTVVRPSIRRSAPKRRVAMRTNPFAASVGKIATFSGLSYSLSALNACGMKCSLTFRDSGGNRIQAIFFTGAYAPALRKKGGRATITGRVAKKGGDYTIQLQSIR